MQIVCGECGRTIENEFPFCPWCGTNRVKGSARILSQTSKGAVRWLSQEGHNVKVSSFEARELHAQAISGTELSRAEQHRKITHMTRALDELEKDLAALALSEEMHK
jgi:hypothetical protein